MSIIIETFSYIWPFLVVITALVFFHELGHYLAARRYGIGVDIFSIGFGPEIFGWTDRHKTRWKFSLIPLGGYVKMYGDADASSKTDWEALQHVPAQEREKYHAAKTPWQKIVVAAAGPIANFILTFFLFIIIFSLFGMRSSDNVVGQVMIDTPAAQAGIQEGDQILRAYPLEDSTIQEPTTITNMRQLQHLTSSRPNQSFLITVKRGEDITEYTIRTKEQKLTEARSIGILGIGVSVEDVSFLKAIQHSFDRTVFLTKAITKGLYNLVVGQQDYKTLGGLFSIASIAKSYSLQGVEYLLEIMALLSLNLGIINLLPIPVLDGGHIVFYIIEWIKGKPLSPKVQDWFFKIGLSIVLALMLLAHWNDFRNFKVIEYIKDFISRIF